MTGDCLRFHVRSVVKLFNLTKRKTDNFIVNLIFINYKKKCGHSICADYICLYTELVYMIIYIYI